MTALSCKICAAPLGADAVDRRLAVVTCGHCGSLFDLTRVGEAPQPHVEPDAAPRSASRQRHRVPLPDRFTVERRGGALIVKWLWFQPAHLFLALFALFWDGFIVNWYATTLNGDAGPAEILMAIFPIVHVAAGVVITYAAIAGLLNRTAVVVEPTTDLKISHFPLPWLPAPRIAARDLEQLFVAKKTNQGHNGSSDTFTLNAVLRDHSKVKLLGGLDDPEQALWLEQEIEQLLEIRDRPVGGEHLG